MLRTQGVHPTDFVDEQAYLGWISRVPPIISLEQAIWMSLGVGVFYNTITIDIGEGIPRDLKKKKKEKKRIFLLHLTKIFDTPSNDKKVWKKKKYTQSNMPY